MSRVGLPGWRGLVARRRMADPARQWHEDWAVPHSCADKPGEATREWDRTRNPGFQHGEIEPQTSDWKHLWGLIKQWDKLAASGESSLERPTGSYNVHTPIHLRISSRRALICLWKWGKWLKTSRDWSKQNCSLWNPCPTYSVTMQQHGLPHPGELLRLHPLLCNSYDQTNKTNG